MQANVGAADRVIRIVVGLILLGLLVALEGNARWFGLIGLVPLVTGLSARCPMYVPLGIDTCRGERSQQGAGL